MYPLTGKVNFSFVRLVLAEEDFHEGGFSGAILPQDRVNLTRFYLEIDPIIGHDPWESFGNAPGL